MQYLYTNCIANALEMQRTHSCSRAVNLCKLSQDLSEKTIVSELWIMYHVHSSDQDIKRCVILTQSIISKTQQTPSNANCGKLALLTDC